MPRLSYLGLACLCGLVAVWGAGCTGNTPPAGTASTAGTSPAAGHDEHGHDDHDKDGHEKEGHDEHEHQHADTGPHKGVLVMFEGHAAHLELVFDAKTGTITAYPLDGRAEKELPVDGDKLEMSFIPREGGDPKLLTLKKAEGTPVKFTGQDDGLKDKAKWDGAFTSVKIGGKEYKETTFKFPEGNHDH
jgi:hypothetical protein